MTAMEQALDALGKGQGSWTKDTAENVAKIIAAKDAKIERLRRLVLAYADLLEEKYGSMPSDRYPGPPRAIIAGMRRAVKQS